MENSQAECAQQGIDPLSVQLPEGGRVMRGIVEPLLGLEKSVDGNSALIELFKNVCAVNARTPNLQPQRFIKL